MTTTPRSTQDHDFRNNRALPLAISAPHTVGFVSVRDCWFKPDDELAQQCASERESLRASAKERYSVQRFQRLEDCCNLLVCATVLASLLLAFVSVPDSRGLKGQTKKDHRVSSASKPISSLYHPLRVSLETMPLTEEIDGHGSRL
jgi:hypothetical protein